MWYFKFICSRVIKKIIINGKKIYFLYVYLNIMVPLNYFRHIFRKFYHVKAFHFFSNFKILMWKEKSFFRYFTHRCNIVSSLEFLLSFSSVIQLMLFFFFPVQLPEIMSSESFCISFRWYVFSFFSFFSVRCAHKSSL